MRLDPWGRLRDARYALPRYVETRLSGPDGADAVRVVDALRHRGIAATVGYFHAAHGGPDDIVAANTVVAALLGGQSRDVYLSVKAPPLSFDGARLRTIADAARTAGLGVLFDAHSAGDADRTLDALSAFLPDFPGTGCALPARWRRSRTDAERFRDTTARIRVVKGEWADPERDQCSIEESYIALIAALAGRTATVAVATHDPEIAERALTVLLKAGTPCELEQLRGLPARRTLALAERLGVPVRTYVPFGPGWWPYALDKALARPYLASWIVRDALGA
jgi:proline dehydrogenase